MRKSKLETAQTRQRIVETAATEFRRSGINGIGIADLMSAAGLTHGGFYRHFESKDQLVAEAFAASAAVLRKGKGKGNGFKAAVSTYLSTTHRDNPSGGCPLAALGSELVRSEKATRIAATQAFVGLVDTIAAQLDELRPDVAKRKALVTVTTMIGALTMSRVVFDTKLSAEILQQTKKYLTRA